MSPISSDGNGSPLKTTSSSRDNNEGTKAKKSRMNEECPSSSTEDELENDIKVKQEIIPSQEPREKLKATRYFKGKTEVEKSRDLSLVKNEEDEDDIKVEIRSRSESIASSINERPSSGMSDDTREGNKRHASTSSNYSDQDSKPKTYELETDSTVLARREKQIEYGKNTTEYFNYVQAVPKCDRQKFHPKTPNKHRKYSRRAWDGLVRQWRLNLHCWSEFPISASSELQENDGREFNESFHSESTVETNSTSSSIAAAFSSGIVFSNSNAIIKKETYDSEEEEPEDYTGRRRPNKKLLLDTVNVKKESEPRNIPVDKLKVKEVLSTSWADEVEDYLDECATDNKG